MEPSKYQITEPLSIRLLFRGQFFLTQFFIAPLRCFHDFSSRFSTDARGGANLQKIQGFLHGFQFLKDFSFNSLRNSVVSARSFFSLDEALLNHHVGVPKYCGP